MLFTLPYYAVPLHSPQLIFSIKSQGGEVVASPTLPECKIIAGSKRYMRCIWYTLLCVVCYVLCVLIDEHDMCMYFMI